MCVLRNFKKWYSVQIESRPGCQATHSACDALNTKKNYNNYNRYPVIMMIVSFVISAATASLSSLCGKDVTLMFSSHRNVVGTFAHTHTNSHTHAHTHTRTRTRCPSTSPCISRAESSGDRHHSLSAAVK